MKKTKAGIVKTNKGHAQKIDKIKHTTENTNEHPMKPLLPSEEFETTTL